MENQTNTTSTKQIMLNYGLILGVASIFIAVVNYALGNIYEPHWSVQIVSVVVSIVMIVMGLKKVKENNGGYLTLGQSFKTGLGITLISIVIGFIYTIIFTKLIEPEYFNRLIEFQQQVFMDKYPNFSDEQIEAGNKGIEKMANLYASGAIAIIGGMVFGFIISLIAGLIMKKSDEETNRI